jgi:Fe-S-cluster containining protein
MKLYWYANGLHFECLQCGACCSGPAEGYIWVGRREIELIAEFLKLSEGQLRQKYLKRRGLRTTIIENPATKDCIFLEIIDGRKRCTIYPVRPNQCRSWPFWPENLANPNAWNRAAGKCPGINRGRCYSFEEIEKISKQKDLWSNDKHRTVVKKVGEIYNWLDSQVRRHSDLAGRCDICGRCCSFENPADTCERGFDHRLFITTPELMYLAGNLGAKKIKPMQTSRCPYNTNGRCTIYEYRFAGCRIFCCKADVDFQSRLSELVIKKFKSICTEFQIPYRYADLASALNGPLD